MEPERADDESPGTTIAGALRDDILSGRRVGGERLVTEHWPNIALSTLTAACTKIQQSRTWDTVRIDGPASDRWMRILQEEGMVLQAPRFEDLVTSRVVDAAEPATVGRSRRSNQNN